ncbi:molybdopterin-dependent oxidoreductase [Ammoniphilus sp. CFH 90114]|uniref:molybdopterin-containing oxidoreductase family protein n=1 Tax=Ammoniphilus sp. CFH 90114 TaxID=2493665 RepID=UPI0010100325|nr:molybdopterin oxidoreductase family protein [Ammoniphilus sp. CFH 90114]RXT06607.1 molybdopterin oxidoreductase family protein [Ammoniphilus sp. CFH 90114]
MPSYIDQPEGVFPSVCSLDCPDTCGLLVHKKEGKIVKIEGDPTHPITQGAICNKVRNMPARLYDVNRLAYPMRRIGAKGEGRFERISWDEAVKTIVQQWTRLIHEHGSESILPYSFAGNMGRLNMVAMGNRFFERLGASRLDRTICNAAGNTGYRYTMGATYGTDPEDTIHSKLHIYWGCDAFNTNMHQIMFSEKARKNGAQIVVIDVQQNRTGQWADWFIPIVPGTDAALALGLMHILFKEGFIDEHFMHEYTLGFQELAEQVKEYDPETVSAITKVPVADIYRLARLYGETSPSFIRIGNGPQHHDNGGMFVRTVSCLPSLTGQWMVKGGGALRENGDFAMLQFPSIPYNRQQKPTRLINMNQIGEALTEFSPPIHSLFVYGTNPLVVTPDLNKVKKGFAREDLFTVVHDLFLTETAKYADIVLPATSSYENLDIYTSYWHHYVHLQRPVMEPYGESKSNVDVFRLLARGMGYQDKELYETEEDVLRNVLSQSDNPYLKGISLDKLKEKSFMKLDRNNGPMFPNKLPTPSGKIELLSEKMASIGLPALPVYASIKEGEKYPLLFIPGPNRGFLNSTFSNNEKHMSMEKGPFLHIHPKDAGERCIKQGEMVRVFNDRGECEFEALVTERVIQGTVVTHGLWSDQPGTKRLVNSLTSSRLADMGGGATFFSTKVEVRIC